MKDPKKKIKDDDFKNVGDEDFYPSNPNEDDEEDWDEDDHDRDADLYGSYNDYGDRQLIMKITFTAGRMLCRPIRDFLQRCKFDDLNIEFYESSGFLERTFMVKGNEKDVTTVRHSLYKWFKKNNL